MLKFLKRICICLSSAILQGFMGYGFGTKSLGLTILVTSSSIQEWLWPGLGTMFCQKEEIKIVSRFLFTINEEC